MANTQNKWGKMKVIWHRIANTRRRKVGGEAERDNCTSIRWLQKMRASDWLLNAWIPDGNQNMDQKSLVRLCISYSHEEKPNTPGELCVWEKARTWKSCVCEPGSRSKRIRSRFLMALTPWNYAQSHIFIYLERHPVAFKMVLKELFINSKWK